MVTNRLYRRQLLHSGVVVTSIGLAGCSALPGEEPGADTAEAPEVSTTTTKDSEEISKKEDSKKMNSLGDSWPSPNFDRQNTNYNQGATAISSKPESQQIVSLPIDDIIQSVVQENKLYVSGFGGTVVRVDLQTRESSTILSEQPSTVEYATSEGLIVSEYSGNNDLQDFSGISHRTTQGSEKWYQPISNGKMRLSSQILRENNYIYFLNRTQDFAGIQCLDADTGEKVWKQNPFQAAESFLSDEIKEALRGERVSYAGIAVANGSVFFKTVGGVVITLDAKTGDYLWHYVLETGRFRDHLPIIADDTLILSRGGHLKDPPVTALVGVDIDKGTEKWSKDAHIGPPIGSARKDYIFTLVKSGIRSLRSDSGEIVWETDKLPEWPGEDSSVGSATNVGGGDFVYHLRFSEFGYDIPDDEPTVEIRCYNSSTSEQVWTTTIRGVLCYTDVLVVSNAILLHTLDGDLLIIYGRE